MKITRHALSSSFALLDQQADQGVTIPDILNRFGLKFDDAVYVAEQRGLRAALIATDDLGKLLDLAARPDPTPVALDQGQQRIMTIAAACELEAIAATLQMVRSSG